jgi:hypothetical protein
MEFVIFIFILKNCIKMKKKGKKKGEKWQKLGEKHEKKG